MARGRLAMRKVKKILAFHFDEGRSACAIATHCGLARRSVAQTLERFAASGLSWLEARDLDEEVLEAALYRISGLRIGRRWTGRRSRKTCPAVA